ncbi:hypothetical protein AAEP93_005650 [Penicillium crustosum]
MPTPDLKDFRAQLETPDTNRPTPQAPAQGTATGHVPVQAAAQAPAQSPAPVTPEPQQRQRPSSADTDMEEDEEDLSHNEKLLIIRAISDASDDPTMFKNALDNALPFAVDFRKLQALLHPDKYHGEEKIQAQKAFQKLLSFREKSGGLLPGEADRHTNFYYGNDASRPVEHVEGRLSSYHKDAYERATPHLKANLEGLDEKAKAAVAALDSINAEMRVGNEQMKKDPDLGTIRAGGQYGLNWLAVGELEPGKSRLPFIVAGFWHQGPTTPLRAEGVSRSALKKILAPREADRLIAENMIGDPGYSVKEALTILSPVANSHYRSGALLALPDKEQNFYSWFLSMPQQFPPALNAP